MTSPAARPLVSRQGGWWLVGVSVLGIGVGLYRVMHEPQAVPQLPVATAVAPERPNVALPPIPGGFSTPALMTAASLETAVEAWRAAWASRDPAAYLAHYATDFPNRATFARRKSNLLNGASIIEVELASVVVSIENGRGITRFTQLYRSDSHRSKNLKELIWVEQDGQLRILSETAIR